MQLPHKLRGANSEELLDYAIERMLARTRFQPGKRYKLNVRRRHSADALRRLRSSHPEFFEDSGVLKRTEHWANYRPIQYFRIPRRREASRADTALEDMRTQDEFFQWFTTTFAGLEDGVYGAIQRKGKGHGTATLFVLELKNGKVDTWKKKSNGADDRPSNYYAFPLYFKLRDDLGV